MKRQIRRGVYETNSSSTHSISMCTESEYDAWENGDLLLYSGYGSYFGDKPVEDHFYTREQAIEFEKHRRSKPLDDDLSDISDEELINEILMMNILKHSKKRIQLQVARKLWHSGSMDMTVD